MLFCRKICFVAIYALLRGEKLSKKLQISGVLTTVSRLPITIPPSFWLSLIESKAAKVGWSTFAQKGCWMAAHLCKSEK